MQFMEKLLICLLFALAIFALFPIILTGMETEQNMRRAQVQSIFNVER